VVAAADPLGLMIRLNPSVRALDTSYMSATGMATGSVLLIVLTGCGDDAGGGGTVGCDIGTIARRSIGVGVSRASSGRAAAHLRECNLWSTQQPPRGRPDVQAGQDR